MAYRGWHWVNRQEKILTGGERRGGRWKNWRIINNKRWNASWNFIHASCWWHKFWFLAEFHSIYSLKKVTQLCLSSNSFFPSHRWQGSTRLYSEWMLQHFCTILYSGTIPQKLKLFPQIRKTPLLFPASWISLCQVLFLPPVSLHPFSGPPIPSGLY